MRRLVLLSILVIGSNSFAVESSGVDCSILKDPEDRLACYDSQHVSEVPAEAPTADPIEVAPVSVAAPVIADEAQEAPAPPITPASPTAPTEPAQTGFLGDAKVDLTSSIRAVRAGEKQKMVFLLENEQIWIQSSPRPLPFKNGDTVTVKNAKLGGYFMRTESGVSTRVQRIQ